MLYFSVRNQIWAVSVQTARFLSYQSHYLLLQKPPGSNEDTAEYSDLSVVVRSYVYMLADEVICSSAVSMWLPSVCSVVVYREGTSDVYPLC